MPGNFTPGAGFEMFVAGAQFACCDGTSSLLYRPRGFRTLTGSEVLRILDRYIFREVTLTWIGVTGVLLIILLSNQLATVLSQAAANNFPRGTVAALLGLSSVQQLPLVVPIGLFLSITLSLGRLYHESEMAAIQACGIGQVDLYKPIAWLAVFIIAALAWLAFVGVPQAAAKTQSIRAEALRQARFGNLEPGRFRTFGAGDIVFYAERVDGNGVLYNVFVEHSENGREEIAVAARAEQRGAGNAEQLFVLYDGKRYEGVPGQGDYKIVQFSEHGIPLSLPDPSAGAKKRDAATTRDLLASSKPSDRAELQTRMSVPIMAFVLTVIAVPLSRLRPRQGRYGRMGIAILVVFFYANWLEIARVWIEKETLPAGLGLWWVHAIMLAFGLLMLVRDSPPFAAARPALAR